MPWQILISALILALATSTAMADPKTVTLSVPGMTCPVCPLTVKQALGNVEGVSAVDVDFDRREATVTFDDAQTGPGALRAATAGAGYPSTLKP